MERRRTRAPQDHDSRRRRSRTPSPSETNVYSQRPRYDRDDNRRHRKDSGDHRSHRRDEIDQKLREETAKIFQQALDERKKINEANQNRKIEQDVTDPSEKEVHILKRERESSPKRPIRDRGNSPSRVISKLPRSSQGPISDENPTDAQPQPPSEEINHPQVSSPKDQRSRAPPESSQLSTSNQPPKSEASKTKVQPAKRNESASPAAPRKRQPPLSSLEEVMSRVKQEMEKAKQQKQKGKPKEEEAKAFVSPVASTTSADQATLSSSVEPQAKVKPPVKELKPAPVPDTNPWKQKAETTKPPSEESAPSKKKRKESEVAEIVGFVTTTESPQPESSLAKKAASRQSARGRGRGRGRVTSTSSSTKGRRAENTKNLSNNDILYYQTQGFFIKKKEISKADDDASETQAKESDDGSDQLPDLVKSFYKSSVTSSEENMKLKEPMHSGAVVVEGIELSPDQYEEGEFTEIKSRRKKKLEKQGSSESTADVNGKKSAKETKRKQADKNLKGPVPEKVPQSDNTSKKAQLSKDVSSSKQPQPISKPQLSKSSSQPSIVATSGHEQRAKSEPPTVPRVSIQSSSPLSSPQQKKLVDRAVARPESPTSQQQKSATSQIISKNPWGSPSVGFSNIISPTSPQSIPHSNVWKDIQDNSFKSLVDFSQINQAEDSEHEKEDHDDETLIAANKMVEGVLGETEDISKPVLNISPSSSPQTAASSIPPSTSNANQTFVRPIQPVPGFYGPQSVIAPVHGFIRPPGPHHQDQPQWQFVFAYPTHPQSSGQQLRMPTYSNTWMAPRPVPAPGMQFDPKLFSSSQPPAVPSFFDKPYTSVNSLYPSQVSSQSSSHSSQPAPIGQSNASQYRPGGKQYTPLLIDPSSFGMSMGLPVNINGMGVGIGMPMPMMSVNMNQMNQNAKPPSSVPATSDSVNVNHSSVNRMSVSSSPKPSSVSTSQPPSSSMSPPRRAAPGHHKFNARPQVSAKATKSPPKPTLTHNTPGSVPSVSPQPSASGAKTSTVSSTQRPVPSVHTGPPPRRQFIPPRGYQAGPPRGFRPHFNARPSYSPRPFFGAGRGRGAGPQRFNQRPSSSAKVGDKVNTTTQDDEGTKETQEENKESAEINAVQDGEGMNTVKSDAPTQNESTIQDNADVAKEPTGTSSEKETAHELSSAEETKENEEPSKTDSGTEPTTESAAKPTSSKGVRNMSHRPIIARPKGHYYGPPSARGNYRGGFMPTRGRGGSAFNSSRGGFGAPRGGIGGARGGFAARGGQGRGGIASRGSRGRGGSS
ncbi:hypothetical protein BKA69DRAFT_122205 [Paraphysoderma sedebokerense]|nr:hypothetical protein BKA69DRAFT_122205 [Paraphysoderma sedebokerense]